MGRAPAIRMAARLAGALLVSATLAAGASHAAGLTVYSAGAVKAALAEAAANYEKSTGQHVAVDYVPVGTLMRGLEQGAQQDAIVLSAEQMAQAEQKGWAMPGSSFALGTVAVGLAVREGAPIPDISTPDKLKQTLLAARSITYVAPDKGTSGKHFAGVVQQMGIADALKARTVLADGGYALEPVARGEVEIGVQQITEILPVKGIRLVGPLPAPFGKTTVYAIALSANAKSVAEATAFFTYLRSAEVRRIFVAKGFQVP
ncbi:molybdate ABC transporter substrate-binding protein [Undibacterium sp. TJN25]|uniref:molybdate ABC transporter substrate-binding protein n=1 Tax=Undibacterium sp. TJN25 TaxID=3413056 RepID=UPI003BEF4F6F